MLNGIKEIFVNLDELALKIMKYGLKFCVFLLVFSSILLFTYSFLIHNSNLYHIGFLLAKSSIILGVEFVVCGIIVDGIKKQFI